MTDETAAPRSDTPENRRQLGANGAENRETAASERKGLFAHVLGRRAFLTGSAGVGLAAGAAGLAACSDNNESNAATDDASEKEAKAAKAVEDADGLTGLATEIVPFDGTHQAGIDTPAQAHMALVGVNCKDGITKDQVRKLLMVWTLAARPLTQGQAPLAELEPEMVTRPANLTITLGIGRPLLDKMGMGDKAPDWLHDIPHFDRDKFDPQWAQTDLALQFCCDDPTTLAHAMRFVLRAGRTYAKPAWTQHGFLYARGTQTKGSTPRNLFGFLDGTVNPRTQDDLNDIVWISDGPQWMHGGTAMVVRRISLNLDTWDILDRETREVVFGRKVDTGAPLSGEKEFDDPDFDKVDDTGLPLIDPNSHMARSHYEGNNTHERILRRAYNYDMPVSGGDSVSDAGLVFTCFQQNPDKQFTPIQTRLDQSDRLNEWTTHIGSAVYACPPATSDENDTWASGLFA